MTADATLPASDDLTPEVLARWEELAADEPPEYSDIELANFCDRLSRRMGKTHRARGCAGCEICTDRSMLEIAAEALLKSAESRTAVPALLSGVRSRDARIVELEEQSRARKVTGENWFHKCMEARTERESLKAALAAREAVLAEALGVLKQHGTHGGWQIAGGEAKRILESGATNG